jgi:hypothetical protein
MAIKSGQFVMTNSGLLIDRVQTGGVSNLGIPSERIYELGNYHTLTTLRDIPDLSFDVESYDVSCKMEALLLGLDPANNVAGTTAFDFNLAQPFNVLSPFRSSQNHFDAIRGLVVPHLALESVAYKFGVKQNASQTYTLKGDSVFFVPNIPYEDVYTSDGTTTTHSLTHTALEYFNTTLGVAQFVVNMSVYYADGTFARLFNGTHFDYTDTSTVVTFNAGKVPVSGSKIRVQYASTTSENILQAANDADGISVSPAAIRAKDIDIYIGTSGPTPTFSRWTGVQSFDCTWKVNLDPNLEFGNPLTVSSDYVTAEVDGTITTRDVSVTELFNKIYQATNVPTNQVAGALSSTPIPVEIRLSNPDTGTALKTIYIPDARFEPPTTSGRVNQKLDTPFKYSSDTGLLFVYDGQRPGSAW